MAGILVMKKSYRSTITLVIPLVITCAVDHANNGCRQYSLGPHSISLVSFTVMAQSKAVILC